jgi:hypothetical protein
MQIKVAIYLQNTINHAILWLKFIEMWIVDYFVEGFYWNIHYTEMVISVNLLTQILFSAKKMCQISFASFFSHFLHIINYSNFLTFRFVCSQSRKLYLFRGENFSAWTNLPFFTLSLFLYLSVLLIKFFAYFDCSE